MLVANISDITNANNRGTLTAIADALEMYAAETGPAKGGKSKQ